MSKHKIQVKQTMETTEVIAYLEELLKCFKEGKIVVEKGEETISMDLPETVKVEIGAKQKEDKGGFSLEMSWKSEAPEVMEPIRISQCEPVDSPLQPAEETGPEEGEPGPITARTESSPVAAGSSDDVMRRKSDVTESPEKQKETPPPAAGTEVAPAAETGKPEQTSAPAEPVEPAPEKAAPASAGKNPAPKGAQKKPAAKPAAGKKTASKTTAQKKSAS
jgi:amphi-Trp domain-containing protein